MFTTANLYLVEMNPMPNEEYRIRLRGLSHAQRVYNPNRLKYPMKRVGPWIGKWDMITWTEAISTIVTNLQNVAQRYGSKAVGFLSVSGKPMVCQRFPGNEPRGLG